MYRCTRLPAKNYKQIRNASELARLVARNPPVDVHPEVREALETNKPVVALETTLITHGLPQPVNLEVGNGLEKIVRDNGAIPATIGIIGGRIKIGLEKGELMRLADIRANPSIVKVSRRDIASAISRGLDGGTTCSATLIFAALAGIKVFSTGGLGGVHRGGEISMDVSADLHELTRCPVGLVSSGVKSILDIGRTLEYLETLGVPAISYSESSEFPAFFSRYSGHKVPWNFNDPRLVARMLYTQWQLGFNNGALIGVPIPLEYEVAGARIQAFVEQAIAESEVNGINKRGKEATPWLLARVMELSKGASMESNIALLRNTALVGSQIAVQYQMIAGEQLLVTVSTINTTPIHPHLVQTPAEPRIPIRMHKKVKVMVVGCAAVDLTARASVSTGPRLEQYSTVPGHVTFSLGGVGRNIAEAAHRVISSNSWGFCSLLVAPVGKDNFGQMLLQKIDSLGMRIDGLVHTNDHTAVCNMLLDSGGELLSGVADMDIVAKLEASSVMEKMKENDPQIIVLDGNLSPLTLATIIADCQIHGRTIFFEPTSVAKSTSILHAIKSQLQQSCSSKSPIDFASPNVNELTHMYRTVNSDDQNLTSREFWWPTIDSFNLGASFRDMVASLAKRPASLPTGYLSFLVDQGIVQMAVNLLPLFQHLVIKCGEKGILVVMRTQSPSWFSRKTDISSHLVVWHGNGETVIVQHFPAVAVDHIVNVTGAGDSFVGALIAQLGHQPNLFDDPVGVACSITLAQQAAALTLRSELAVSPGLSKLVSGL